MNLLIPFGQDPLAVAAEQILDTYRDSLPDLSACQVLLADSQCAPRLREQLLRRAYTRGYEALLGPSIDTLDSWLTRFSTGPGRVLARAAQELVLAEALRDAQPVYVDTDPWLLADQLLDLFEELTTHLVEIPVSLGAFENTLRRCYGASEPSPSLQREAWVLHTLWHAWRRQLRAERSSDGAEARLQRLNLSLTQTPTTQLWLLGFERFNPAEMRWLQSLRQQGRVNLLFHGAARYTGNHPDAPLRHLREQLGLDDLAPAEQTAPPPLDRFLRALFDPSELDLKQRASRFAAQVDDPLKDRLSTLCAEDPEQEARAISLQVKRWLLEDRQPIAVITADRRLARRVRALLETSAIVLDDPGGWALSTTSAAATLERWLECVEEDFACAPMLDVLKSAFLGFDEREAHLSLVRRLEQDVIRHENIARSLPRYRYHLDLRSERLPEWSEDTRRRLHALINRLDHAAAPLVALLTGRHSAGAYLEALWQSVAELDLTQSFAIDAAGHQVLDLLQQLEQAARTSSAELDWEGFRHWLGRNLERATFTLPLSGSPVRLLTLEQSRLQHFGAVIVAACSREHLPGGPPGLTFFNQRVRAQLGLPTWPEAHGRSLHHFCRVLQSAGRVLLTRHRYDDGEPVPPSPWLELLEAFHANAYGGSLLDQDLWRLLRHPQAQTASPDSAAVPGAQTRPAPRAEPRLLPKRWSAYTHQRIVDCPYRFFAADVLGLKPREEIREALSKSDYGALIHRVLQAFHSDVPRLPGPWTERISETNRGQALALLHTISDAVFAPALRDNFQARGWLQQWLDCLSPYLDWLIARQSDWRLEAVEVSAECNITPHLRLRGRIDRIDRQADVVAVVDYKTGQVPARQALVTGEAVQLPSYALLVDDEVAQLEYLQLGNAGVKAGAAIEGEPLRHLLTEVETRLRLLDDALRARAALPAWGDDKVCGYCEFRGLCRRDNWNDGGGAS